MSPATACSGAACSGRRKHARPSRAATPGDTGRIAGVGPSRANLGLPWEVRDLVKTWQRDVVIVKIDRKACVFFCPGGLSHSELLFC